MPSVVPIKAPTTSSPPASIGGRPSMRRVMGPSLNVKTANTSDEMVALMNEGRFDLVTASGDALLRLVAGKRVQPINPDLIPSWKDFDPRLESAPWNYPPSSAR